LWKALTDAGTDVETKAGTVTTTAAGLAELVADLATK